MGMYKCHVIIVVHVMSDSLLKPECRETFTIITLVSENHDVNLVNLRNVSMSGIVIVILSNVHVNVTTIHCVALSLL